MKRFTISLITVCSVFACLTSAYAGSSFRDRNRDRTLYDRNSHLGDWDYRTNWRYDRDAYYRGDIRPYSFYYGTDNELDRSPSDDYRRGYRTPDYLYDEAPYYQYRQPNTYYYFDNSGVTNGSYAPQQQPVNSGYMTNPNYNNPNITPNYNYNNPNSTTNYSYSSTGNYNAYPTTSNYPQYNGYNNMYQQSYGSYPQDQSPTYYNAQ